MKKLLLVCLVLGCSAFADQVNCVKWKDSSGTTVGTYCKPFTIKAGTNITFSDDQLTRVITIDVPSIATSTENIRYVDQYTGSVFSAKQIACNADAIGATGGTCDAYASSGAQTISAETPVGNTSGNSVLLRLPPYILATVSITDGTSCGVKLYDKSSIIGAGTGGSSNTQILGQNGTAVDSLFCTDGSSSGQYVNAEGMELFNPTSSTATYANGLANIQHLYDNSHLSRIFTRAPGVTGFFAHDFCCGTLMEMVGSNGFGVASSIPCSIGKNGEHSNGILIGFSCVHPGDTKNAFILNSSGTSYSALDMLGSYTECNSTDTTTPLFQLNGGANDSVGMYGIAIAGPACAGGTTAYLIDIAAAMKGGILTNIRRGGLSNTINDHVNSRTSNASYIPLYTFGGADYFSSFIVGNSSLSLAGTTGSGTSIVTNNAPTITGSISVNDAAATNRAINFNTAGSARWIQRANNTAEGGANAGSDFELVARDDSGNFLATTIGCTRSTSNCTFAGLGTFTGGVKAAGAISPTVAGAQTAGTNALPFSSAFIGAAATNNAQLTGTFTAARVHTLPDITGKVGVYLSASDAAVDLASVASAACTSERSVAVSGAAFGDPVQVMAGTSLEDGTFLKGHVISSGNIKWALCNLSGGAVDRASDTYSIRVVK